MIKNNVIVTSELSIVDSSDVDDLSDREVLGPDDYEFSLISDNLEREYIVHVSSSYDVSQPIPIVFNICGRGKYPYFL